MTHSRMTRGAMPHDRAPKQSWATRFVRRVLLWMVPTAIVWMLITPFYNRFLTRAGQNVVRMTESPAATRLQMHKEHDAIVTRVDLKGGAQIGRVRVTDIHFPLILLGAFFLAVPGASWRQRLGPLGWALLFSVFFHIVSLVFWVKFIYATQLGTWSAQHFSTFQQNFWGLGKHLLDLPFKFGMPVILWAAFFLGRLMGEEPPAA